MGLVPDWMTLWMTANEIQLPMTKDQAKAFSQQLELGGHRLAPVLKYRRPKAK